jgi:hypothetical protein
MWIGYGFASRDPFMFPANVAGIIVALYCAVATYALAERKVRRRPGLPCCAALVALCAPRAPRPIPHPLAPRPTPTPPTPAQAQNFMLAMLCFTAAFVPLFGIMVSFVISDRARQLLAMGLAADAVTIL